MKWVNHGTRTILIVEPDEPTITSVVETLRTSFRTVTTRSGEEAIRFLAKTDPDLVLVAYDLPDTAGPDLCRLIRAHTAQPVIFMSGLDSDAEALASFAAGADCYIRKPYRLRELDARIQAALRHVPANVQADCGAITVGDVALDPDRHRVQIRGRAVNLPLREFDLLSVLLMSPGKVWTREALMRRIWGETPPSGTKSLDVHIRRIRSRIEDDPSRPSRILTVRGVGYRYSAPSDDRAMSG